ncbi:MAG: hypothetical protein F7B60_01435 [Desulfurococcales archaeon]|nr:hypothetical protein [Desulfurococcales archaeon]
MKPSTLRKISSIGIIETLAILAVSLGILPIGYPKIHAKLIVYGLMPVFVYSIAMVYLASSKPKFDRIILPWLLITYPFILVAPFVSLLGNFNVLMYYCGATMIFASIPFFLGGIVKKGSLRISLFLLGLSMLQTGIILLANVLTYNLKLQPSEMGVAALIAFPVTAIYAVSVHAVPKTYRLEPEKLSTAILIASLLLGTIFYTTGYYEYALMLYAISFLAYPVSTRLYRLREWEKSIKAKKDTPGRPGNLYFIYSHYYVVFFTILTPISLYLYTNGLIGNIFTLIHVLTVGFIGIHIYIHAPMMVPVVVDVKTKRRYTVLPPLLLTLAAIIWPFSGILSYVLVILSLCRLFDVILGYIPEKLYAPFRIK